MSSGVTKSRMHLKLDLGTLVIVVCSLHLSNQVQAQCPINTMTSFERISGVMVKDSPLTLLYTAPNISSISQVRDQLDADLARQLASQLSGSRHMNVPITAECNNRCRRSAKCRAFLVDYSRHTCYSVESPSSSMSSSSGLMRGQAPIQLVPTQERTSYFEKICLNTPTNDCERAWVFERVMAHHVQGHDDRIIEDVPSRFKCQEHCLNERDFRCRSGEYDYITMQCRLSTVDRHTKPHTFRATVSSVDYFENQCAPIGSQCDAFDRFDDVDLGRAEIMRDASTSDQCQQFCTQTIKAFICRSFTYNQATGKCYLNSANSFMVGGIDKLISAPGLTYYQRNDCVDLKLECDTSAMTLNLRTNEPFRGRMYVRDEPNACETMGRSSMSSSLMIPFQSTARCATRELPSRYSSVVVVQEHPLIQRKSDRYIKVVCDFQTANKTIMSSYNVASNPWTSTALINATSFAPKIRLRITDRLGSDITGAKLGDELYLHIEAESESAYDMIARSVFAKSGSTDESIMLIDKDGCPTDYRIFPSLKKINRRTIVGRFDAFKFSSDVVVRFQVDVQFCLNQCPATLCDQSGLLLNTNSQSLRPESYSPGALLTTTTTTNSPLTSSPANLLADFSALLASGSSTQTPPGLGLSHSSAPTTSATSNSPNNGNNHNGPRLTPANFSGATHYLPPSVLAPGQQQLHGKPSASADSIHYYNSAAGPAHVSAASQGASYPSTPVNHPQHNQTPPLALDLLSGASNSGGPTTSDPQMFESLQARGLSGGPPSPGAGASGSGTGAESATGAQAISSPVASAGARRARRDRAAAQHKQRHRRSAEPMPSVPSHVPLQREIIVEGSQAASANQARRRQARKSGGSSPAAPKQSDATRPPAASYDLDGNPGARGSAENMSEENGTLLCTTRQSIVFASLIFCACQFLIVVLCLTTWIHRKNAHFSAKHPIQERLY